jgi:sugar O-acyltransferase (sialic acid O-acetyltransferase NeuD family)
MLLGGGGHCRACIDVIEHVDSIEIAGLVLKERGNSSTIVDYPILGFENDLIELLSAVQNALVAVGQIKDPEKRIRLYLLLKKLDARFPTIQSPLSYVSKRASVSEGSIVMHGSVINSGASVGANCIINTKALLEHDVEISDHCHIATGALVNGGVKIGCGSFVGSGSIIKEGVILGQRVVVGAGQIVKENVADGVTVNTCKTQP